MLSDGFDLETSISEYPEFEKYNVDFIKFIDPIALTDSQLNEIFSKFYTKEKMEKNLGEPSFANFRVFVKILAREFLLLYYNVIFVDTQYQKYRKTFFNLLKNLALINSKPAIRAAEEQSKAMTLKSKENM